MINNRKAFEIYMILRFINVITIIFLTGIIIATLLLKINLYQTVTTYIGSYTLLIVNWAACFLLMIDARIKPAFIDLQVIDDKILIRTYDPQFKKWESPFVLLGYKRRIKELQVSREEYNDYKLQFGKFGIKKELKLQKINSSGIYESANINISLLGQKKYTRLIVVIDRLKTKICLN